MEFVIVMKKDNVTQITSCSDLSDPASFQHISAMFDVLNEKFSKKKEPTVKRGRGRPRKHPKGE